jgi:hypothetical protein
MNRTVIATAILLGATSLSMGAFAQTATTNPAPAGMQGTLNRDVNQQQRIENGLQNGTITTREGAELERDEAKVDRMQAHDMRDGSLNPAEQARLTAAQNRVSQDIHQATTNGVNGNPMSASSQRMQTDVQRNINQQDRIADGMHDGSLTGHEASRMERAQGRTDVREYQAGRDGHIGAHEQANLKQRDNRVSQRLYNQKHDAQHRH